MTTDSAASRLFTALAVELGSRPAVRAAASDERVFGARALKINGKIFAMLLPRETFVVKLPRQRVADLVATGRGINFGSTNGRPMKEWLDVSGTDIAAWRAFALEALAFVAGA